MSGHHDLGYKYLFAHSELVRELIAGFTPFHFLNGVDASAFERTAACRRYSRWCSTTEAIAGTQSIELSEMVGPAPDGLSQFQARQRYFLIDQKRLDPASLAEQKTVLSMLFRMELSELPDVVVEVAPMLRAWLLDDAQAPLRRAVSPWVEQLLNREARGEATIALILDAEGTAMGMRKFETWADALEDRGLQRGLQQGKEQGLEQGLEQGRRHEAATLKGILERILQARFGAIPEAISARIVAASIDETQCWIDRALTASSLESLIKPGGHGGVAPLK